MRNYFFLYLWQLVTPNVPSMTVHFGMQFVVCSYTDWCVQWAKLLHARCQCRGIFVSDKTFWRTMHRFVSLRLCSSVWSGRLSITLCAARAIHRKMQNSEKKELVSAYIFVMFFFFFFFYCCVCRGFGFGMFLPNAKYLLYLFYLFFRCCCTMGWSENPFIIMVQLCWQYSSAISYMPRMFEMFQRVYIVRLCGRFFGQSA